LIVEIDICHKPLLKARDFSSSSSDKMIKPYVEYRGVYGGGADERVDR
jgi:hypothetical protein